MEILVKFTCLGTKQFGEVSTVFFYILPFHFGSENLLYIL